MLCLTAVDPDDLVVLLPTLAVLLLRVADWALVAFVVLVAVLAGVVVLRTALVFCLAAFVFVLVVELSFLLTSPP